MSGSFRIIQRYSLFFSRAKSESKPSDQRMLSKDFPQSPALFLIVDLLPKINESGNPAHLIP